MFCCEYCEIFKSSFFIEHFQWLLLNSFQSCDLVKTFLIVCCSFSSVNKFQVKFLLLLLSSLLYKLGKRQTIWLLDPRPYPEGSYELGSVRPSVLPCGSFLGIGSLVFSEIQHGVRSPCGVVRDRARFFGEKVFTPKMGQNRVFECIGKFSH